MTQTPPDPQNSIPEGLRNQLEAFRKQLWRRKVVEAAAAGLIGLLLSFLLIFGLDRIWQTPDWARLAILLGGVSLFAGFRALLACTAGSGDISREGQLARLIAFRNVSRVWATALLGVIELHMQVEFADADSLSPTAPRRRHGGGRCGGRETGSRYRAAEPERHRKWGLAAILLMGLVRNGFSGRPPRRGLNAARALANAVFR